MVEVFKTNVHDPHQATQLTRELHERLMNHQVNFDLEDVDRILRVQCNSGSINPHFVIKLLQDHGFAAEVLPD
jgi:hypothetical protein